MKKCPDDAFYQYKIELLREALDRVQDLHSEQEITLPDGSWGLNCQHCDGWEYPCATIKAMDGVVI